VNINTRCSYIYTEYLYLFRLFIYFFFVLFLLFYHLKSLIVSDNVPFVMFSEKKIVLNIFIET